MSIRLRSREGRFGLVLGVFTALWAAGCAEKGPKLVPVAGKVMAGEEPVPFGSVQFRADTGRGNQSWEVPTGVIQPDGSFEIMTGSRKGAPLGWWKVLVIGDNYTVEEPAKQLVPYRYPSVKETDLTVEVVEHPGEGAYVFKLNP
jgi:hypothetical protein